MKGTLTGVKPEIGNVALLHAGRFPIKDRLPLTPLLPIKAFSRRFSTRFLSASDPAEEYAAMMALYVPVERRMYRAAKYL